MGVKGKKVLHLDRNDHYGGYVAWCHVPSQHLHRLTHASESSSLNIKAV